MYKKISTGLLLSVLITLLIYPQTMAWGGFKTASSELRGVWVSSVANIDYPKNPTTSAVILKREADFIIKKAKEAGLNAIFLQVRPTADALYQSELFPYSKWLTGTQGLAPEGGFDPLAYYVEACHKEGLELHAWINPYRIAKNVGGRAGLASLAASHPAKLHPDWVVAHENSLYFDPGLPTVRDLIADGVEEIVRNYEVDGIHFDDYFYPGTDFGDSESFKKYGSGLKLADWRRQNVNDMVREVRDRIKAIKKDVSFGISPFGIWQNKSSNPKGSNTKGNESYNAHYADSLYWIQNGLIDYIIPQIYWHSGFEIADYKVLTDWWSEKVRGTSCKLYIGHAAYRMLEAEPGSPWYGSKELLSQIKYNKTKPEISGSVFFSMRSLLNQPRLIDELALTYGSGFERLEGYEIGVHSPRNGTTTAMSVHYIGGLSDPNYPLTMNGVAINDRSINGFFGVLVDLDYGKNEFHFKNGKHSFDFVIYRDDQYYGESYGESDMLQEAAILQESCYPQKTAIVREGGSLHLECLAPSGASVLAEICGHKIPLVREWGGDEPSLLIAKYVGEFKPEQGFKYVEMYDYGKVTYHMYYDGEKSKTSSSAPFYYVADRSMIYASVNKVDTDLWITSDPSEGSAEILDRSMIESLISTDGDVALLGSERYADFANFDLSFGVGSLHSPEFLDYSVGKTEDVIRFKLEDKYAVIPTFDGKFLNVEIAGAGSLKNIAIPPHAFVNSQSAAIVHSRGYYQFGFKDVSQYLGAYVDYDKTTASLHIRKKPGLGPIDKPLQGISIMIDAGHGEKDPGALGLLGPLYAEKHFTLDASVELKEKLEKLGAKVYMTREEDVDVSLYDRLRQCKDVKPHLFISIHANSASHASHLNEVEGFSVYYAKPLARPISDILQYQVVEKLGRNDRAVLDANFYVVRAEWTPSILLEAGFMPNPNDFDWLISKGGKDDYTDQIIDAVLKYFSNGGR